MSRYNFSVVISYKSDEIISISEGILEKDEADGDDSPLKVMNRVDFKAKTIAARAKDTEAKALNRSKEAAVQARDNALGINSMSGSVDYYVKAARDILLALYKGKELEIGDWGYDINRSGGGISIVIPKNAKQLYELAELVLAKHTADGNNSPLSGLNIVDFTAKTNTAKTKYALAKQLTHEKEVANKHRDTLCGIDKNQDTTTPGTLLYYVTQARTILLGLNKGNETELELWGFDVQHGTATPSTPTEICITGRVTDNNNNPVNNAIIKIVELNVTVQSNSEGIYEIPMQTAGSYTVEVSKTNCTTRVFQAIIIAAGTVTGLDVMLSVMSGSVIANVFFNGQPLSAAVVAITEINLSVVTDAYGIANLNNITPGNYNVLVTATGKAPLTLPVTVAVNTITSLNFNMVEQS